MHQPGTGTHQLLGLQAEANRVGQQGAADALVL